MSSDTRSQTIHAVEMFLDALVAGEIRAEQLTENTGIAAKSIAGEVRACLYRAIFADKASQVRGFFAVLETNDGPAIAGGTLTVDDNGAWSEPELVVCRQGESSVFWPAGMVRDNLSFDAVLSDSNQTSADAMLTGVVAYFDGIEQQSSAGIPFHDECQRWENGVQTTSNPRMLGGFGTAEQLDRGILGHIKAVRDRRFHVADEERGLLLCSAFLDVPGTVQRVETSNRAVELPDHVREARSVYLFELFSFAADEISRIDAVMVNLPFGTERG